MAIAKRTTKKPLPPPVVWTLELSDEEMTALCGAVDMYLTVRRSAYQTAAVTKRLSALRALRTTISDTANTDIEQTAEEY